MRSTVRWRAADDLAARIHVIENAIAGRIIFSTSLGLEDQVLLHAIVRANAEIEAITLDTGRHFPETYDTLCAHGKGSGTRIRIVMPDAIGVEDSSRVMAFSAFSTLSKNGKPAAGAQGSSAQAGSVRRGRMVTGIRREQSGTRDETPFAQFDSALNLIKVYPLADRTLERGRSLRRRAPGASQCSAHARLSFNELPTLQRAIRPDITYPCGTLVVGRTRLTRSADCTTVLASQGSYMSDRCLSPRSTPT